MTGEGSFHWWLYLAIPLAAIAGASLLALSRRSRSPGPRSLAAALTTASVAGLAASLPWVWPHPAAALAPIVAALLVDAHLRRRAPA